MPVPTLISELSQTASSNSPAGSESPTTADDYFRTYASFIALLRDGKGFTDEVDVASAATCDIGAVNSLIVRITGTTGITSFGTTYNGPRFVRFADALTLTHNATTLILPGGANITTAAGDTLIAVPSGSTPNGWRVMTYHPASLVPGGVSGIVAIANGGTGASTAATAFSNLKQAATDSATGVVELATTAEAAAGTDTTRAITPAGLFGGLNASGTAPIYAARAWVNFNGTGTVAIRASGNVTSITDHGTGDYSVNFTTALPDANYSPVAVINGGSAGVVTALYGTTAPTTSAYRFGSRRTDTSVAIDAEYCSLAFIR